MLDSAVTSLSTVCGNVYPQIPTARQGAGESRLRGAWWRELDADGSKVGSGSLVKSVQLGKQLLHLIRRTFPKRDLTGVHGQGRPPFPALLQLIRESGHGLEQVRLCLLLLIGSPLALPGDGAGSGERGLGAGAR